MEVTSVACDSEPTPDLQKKQEKNIEHGKQRNDQQCQDQAEKNDTTSLRKRPHPAKNDEECDNKRLRRRARQPRVVVGEAGNFSDLALAYPDFAAAWSKLRERKQQQQQQHRYRNRDRVVTSDTNKNKASSSIIIRDKKGMEGDYKSFSIVDGDNQQTSTVGRGKTSFSTHVDDEFNLALTRAILHRDFDLVLPSMPKGRLCPPIPNRLIYVRWLKKLLEESVSDQYFEQTTGQSGMMVSGTANVTSSNRFDHSEKENSVEVGSNQNYTGNSHEMNGGDDRCCTRNSPLRYQGIDLGVGASCVYPLLLSTHEFSLDDRWKFLGTEIDPISAAAAHENVHANQLDDRIEVVLVKPSTSQTGAAERKDCDGTGGDFSSLNRKRNVEGSCNVDDNDKMFFGPIMRAVEVARSIPMFNRHSHNPSSVCTVGCNRKEVLQESEESPAALTVSPNTISDVPGMSSSFGNTPTLPLTPPQQQQDRNQSIPPMPFFDFVMTNPPFYSTTDDINKPRCGDGRTRTAMTEWEGTYPNGEMGFIMDMIRDSLLLKNQITWYTSMTGKKSTLIEVERILKRMGFGKGNVRTTEFVRGKMTRWGIGWTYRKAKIRSLATVAEGGLQQFEVLLQGRQTKADAVEEVVNRLCEYCKLVPDLHLTCSIENVESNDGFGSCREILTVVEEKRDEDQQSVTEGGDPIISQELASLFDSADVTRIQRVCLPREGHFLIDAHVCAVDVSENEKMQADMKGTNDGHSLKSVGVKLTCYSHSPRGSDSVSRICSQMKGEVTRSNRRWRRIIKRERTISCAESNK